MKIEDYSKYYIQGSDHYLIPKNDFIELYNEMVNWKEETTELKEKLKQKQLKDNWQELKEYIVNDINDRNGTKTVEFEEGNRISETISPIYTLMQDKTMTMKEILDKMQELEGSDK